MTFMLKSDNPHRFEACLLRPTDVKEVETILCPLVLIVNSMAQMAQLATSEGIRRCVI